MKQKSKNQYEELLLQEVINKDIYNSPLRAILLLKLTEKSSELKINELYFLIYKTKHKYVDIARKINISEKRVREYHKLLEKKFIT